MADDPNNESHGQDNFPESDSNNEFDQLNDEIWNTRQHISDYYKTIATTLKNIQFAKDKSNILKSSIKLLRAAPRPSDSQSGRSSRSSNQSASSAANGDLLQHHKLKINGKISLLNKISENCQEQSRTVESLKDHLSSLLDDECKLRINLVSAEIETREYNINLENDRRFCEFYRNQIKDRKKELKQYRALKKDAESSLAILRDREEQIQPTAVSKEQEKQISSLQKELVKVETEIQAVRKRIYNLKETAEFEFFEYEKNIQEHSEIANWEEEKNILKTTLNDLQQKVRLLRHRQVYRPSENVSTVASNEVVKSGGLTMDERDMYGSLLRRIKPSALMDASSTISAKEAGDYMDDSPKSSKKSLNNTDEWPAFADCSGFDKLSYDAKVQYAWNQVQEPRVQLAKLLDDNVKTEKEVERARESLQLTVEKFRKKEEELTIDLQKKTREYAKEERELINKIRQLKIKMAQKRLDANK